MDGFGRTGSRKIEEKLKELEEGAAE